MTDKIKVTVWNEFRHEKTNEAVKKLYPKGMHTVIAEALTAAGDIPPRAPGTLPGAGMGYIPGTGAGLPAPPPDHAARGWTEQHRGGGEDGSLGTSGCGLRRAACGPFTGGE